MKKSIFSTTLAFAFALVMFYSCSEDFLNTKPTGSNNSTSLANKKGVNALLIGAYHGLLGSGHNTGWVGTWAWAASPTNWVWGSCASDDATKGSTYTDQEPINGIEGYFADPTNEYIESNWRQKYDAIARCNDVLIVMANASDMTDAEKTGVEAQVRFLRAWFYFNLKLVYNNVPWIDETTADASKVKNDVDIWPMIEADLTFAETNLPETQSEVGRPTTYAAKAVLARVHMFQQDYAAAKPLLDDILGNPAFELMPKYQDNYMSATRNNKESIFEIQYAVNDGAGESANGGYADGLNFPINVDGTGTCCGFFQPTQNFVNAFKTDANGLPLLDTYNDVNLKNDMGVLSSAEFIPDFTQTLDPRLDHKVGRRGVPYLDWGIMRGSDWVRDQGNGGPYINKANMFLKKDAGTLSTTTGWQTGLNTNNYRAYRLAHIMLWRAEIAVEDNELDLALDLVNEIRERAAASVVMGRCNTYTLASQEGLDVDYTQPAANYLVEPYTDFPNQEFARKAVRMEERLEYGMEGHRHFDLVRWGIAAEVINAYIVKDREFRELFGGTTPKSFVAGKHEYWPIPQNQIDLQNMDEEILTQHPAYN